LPPQLEQNLAPPSRPEPHVGQNFDATEEEEAAAEEEVE